MLRAKNEDPYNLILQYWKTESFRTHASTQYRKKQVESIDAHIHALTESRDALLSTQVHPFKFSEGNTIKKLKQLLSMDDTSATHLITTYSKTHKKKEEKKSMFKFIEALLL